MRGTMTLPLPLPHNSPKLSLTQMHRVYSFMPVTEPTLHI